MSLTQVLFKLGAEATSRGATPADEAEYLDRVEIVAGARPSWQEVAPLLLEDERAEACVAVDLAAVQSMQALRASAGRQSVDAEKLHEARMAVTVAEPIAADYPLLAASCGSRQPQAVLDEARLVLDRHGADMAAMARIEGRRLAAKREIRSVADAEAIRASVEAFLADTTLR